MKKKPSGKSSPELTRLKTALEQADERVFEDMAADLFSRLLGDIGVYVAKTGAQFGGDAGTAGLRGRHLRIECKRYQETSKLSSRDLAGEVVQATTRDELLEAWVLLSTKAVSENERNLAHDAGEERGVPIVIIDWTAPPAGVGLPGLAALCASWPEVVAQHAGQAAGDEARALTVQAGSTVQNLRHDLAPWFLGFEALRRVSRRCFERAWVDSAESKATLNQDAAGGRAGVHLIEREAPLKALQQWWRQPHASKTPAMVLGMEGVGKTWVALDWLHRHLDETPISIVVGAGEFVGGQPVSVLAVRELIVRRLRAMTKSTRSDEYWRARVQRLLARPDAEGAVFLLIVDGLNQQPHAEWKALVMALQGDELGGKVRLLMTSRKHYFDVDLGQLKVLEARPCKVEVGPYNDMEFGRLLGLHGMSRDQLHPSLLGLARTPRLFPLVLRLKDSAALQSEASVSRLLFEYGRDVLQLRQHSTLTDDDWCAWLMARAHEYRRRLTTKADPHRPRTRGELAETVSAPQWSPQEVARRLSEVIDGGFFDTIDSPAGARHVLKDEHAMLGLALALLDELAMSGSSTFEAMQAALETWLEPVAAIDHLVGVIRAALAVQSATPGSDGSVANDALLTAWMNAQNPAPEFMRDLAAFGHAFPRSMLTVLEQSTLRSRAAAFNHAIQALRRLERSRVDDWQVVVERMLRWCARVDLPKPEDVKDPQHYAKREHEELITRVGTVEPGALTVLGETLEFAYLHPGDTATAIPGILEGHDLLDFMAVFRRAAVRQAVQVDYRGKCWPGLCWLVMLASQDEVKTRAALIDVAEQLLVTPPEPGIHPRLSNRAAALILRATGEEALELRANALDERFAKGWNYEEDYLRDPANSLFALEFRHVQDVLARAELHPGRRLDRLGMLLAHPRIELPAELAQAVKNALRQQSFDRMDVTGQTTKEQLDYERLELAGARFTPAEFAQATRKRLKHLASRDGASKYWAAFVASQLLLAATPEECQGFEGLRRRSQLASQEDHANTWCLQLELLHQPLGQQLRTLLAAQDFRYWKDLMAVVQPASSQQLHDFLEAHASERDRAARVVMEVLAYQEEPASPALAQALIAYLASEDEGVRAIAFVSLSRCAPQACGRELMAMNWRPSDDDFLAHHGSEAIVAASGHLTLDDVLPQVAPWRWLDAVVERGARPEELRDASKRLLAVLTASTGAIPEFDGIFAARSGDDGDLLRVSVREAASQDEDGSALQRRLSESAEAANRRLRELGRRAADSIESVRAGGHRLYLHSFSRASVEAAYQAAPDVWQQALEGLDEGSEPLVLRVRAAEGLYLVLCEVLLARDPGAGAQLWRLLRSHLRTRITGEGDVPELLHMLFRAPASAPVLELREECASIQHCHTNPALLELVIAADFNDQSAWLDDFIARDAASTSTWRQQRAIVLSALHRQPDVDELQFPQGEQGTAWKALKVRMTDWTNRGACAMHWWRRCVLATDADEMWAAWNVFLSCADRRAWIWMKRLRQEVPAGREDLHRLLDLQYELNSALVGQKLQKQEQHAVVFSGYFLGQETPFNWLTLDGQVY